MNVSIELAEQGILNRYGVEMIGAKLEAINKAVALKPDSIPYHRARAQIATWADEYKIAAESYQIVVDANPDDDDIRLSASRIQSWGGELDESAKNLEIYLKK